MKNYIKIDLFIFLEKSPVNIGNCSTIIFSSLKLTCYCNRGSNFHTVVQAYNESLESLDFITSYRTHCSSTLEIELNSREEYYAIVFLENLTSCGLNQDIIYQHKFNANISNISMETKQTYSDMLYSTKGAMSVIMSNSKQGNFFKYRYIYNTISKYYKTQLNIVSRMFRNADLYILLV